MKSFAVLLVAFAAANAGLLPALPATTLFRAPAHDSAIIQSDRLGGNFAYSVQEAHAYAAVSPVFTNVRTPVGVSYSAPAVYAHPAPIAAPAFAHVTPVALEAPKIEIKTVELPKIELPKIEYKTVELPKIEYKTVPAPIAYSAGVPLAYAGLPWSHAPLSLVEVKAEEKKSE